MTTITLVASLATAAAVGAAGYAAFTGAGAGSRAEVSPALSIPVAQAQSAPRVDAPAAPQAAPAAAAGEAGSAVFSPRECRPEQGIDRDCEYQ